MVISDFLTNCSWNYCTVDLDIVKLNIGALENSDFSTESVLQCIWLIQVLLGWSCKSENMKIQTNFSLFTNHALTDSFLHSLRSSAVDVSRCILSRASCIFRIVIFRTLAVIYFSIISYSFHWAGNRVLLFSNTEKTNHIFTTKNMLEWHWHIWQ